MVESLPSEARLLRLRLGEVSFPLDAAKLMIGRSRSCDVRLRDDTVSRLHAAFVWRAEHLVLEDMGSSNGTFLNGERVLEPRTVVAGDDVRFGSLCGTVERGEPSRRLEDGAEAVLGRPAGLGWRALAVLADLVLFSVGSVIAFSPLLAARYLLPLGPRATSFLSGVGAALWAVFTFYYVLHGWGRRGCTLGLRLCGLRLLDWRHRSPIGYPRAFLRLVALLVTFLTLGLGYLLVPFRRDRKALHDLLAGTLVTRRTAPLGGRPTSA
jgi:uncharacterized RDD family membrane protein YckC